MAGDWIAMRTDLHDEPEVVGVARILGLDEAHVVGLLHRLWSWANLKTEDGIAAFVSAEWLDLYVRRAGFAAALQEVGWLEVNGKGLAIPKFSRWNSKSAKARLLDTKRKQLVRSLSVSGTDKDGTREEKRREENKDPPQPPKGGVVGESSDGEFSARRPAADSATRSRRSRGQACGGSASADFERFWQTYPRKTAKAKAVKAFRQLAPSPELLSLILAAVERQKAWDQWQRGVIPHASTWLNQRRWEDEGQEAVSVGPKETEEEYRARRAMERQQREALYGVGDP